MNANDSLKMVIGEFLATMRAYPDAAVQWNVIPEGETYVITRGIASTAELAYMMLALCDDVERHHQYGKCEHCDKVAMAIRAAKDAFMAAWGASSGMECRQ